MKINSSKLNKIALKTTEKVILKTIDKAEILQKCTSKSIKRTLNYTEKQQDIFFNSLEKNKDMIWGRLNKALDFFSRT